MICIVDCGSSLIDNITNTVSTCEHESVVLSLKEIQDRDLKPFSGIILSGAPTTMEEICEPQYLEQFSFLTDIKIPVLGICNGHQVLGILHGANIQSGKMIKHIETCSIIEQNTLFKGIKSPAKFQEDHYAHISVPKDFILLAQSDSCPNEAMQHREKPLFGVQFHPEASGSSGTKIFQNFLTLC